MAGRKRDTTNTPDAARWVERVAIAALAAIATQGSNTSVAVAAVSIFLIVAIIEESGRRWVWRGKSVTLRSVALGSIGELRLRFGKHPRRARRRRRRSKARKVASGPAAAPINPEGSAIQE